MVEHYYSKNQSSDFDPFLITVRPAKLEFDIYSASAVFSLKHLDKGTEIMLKYADISFGTDYLDLGCGYGVVGITLLKLKPEINLTSVDSSSRAVRLTKKNLKLHKLQGDVFESSIFSKIPDKMFDGILTNPPYSAGRKICFSFIEESFLHLNEGGSLQLVCRRQKGGDTLEKHMAEVFGNVEVIGQKSGFRLYKSIKN